MVEKKKLAAAAPPPAVSLPPRSSPSIRFLGLLKQPDSDLEFELDESDVVYSDLAAGELGSAGSFSLAASNGLSSPSNSHNNRRRPYRPFIPERSGLSAALAGDGGATVRRQRAAGGSGIASPVAVPARAGEGMVFRQSAPVNVPVWPRWKAKGEFAGGMEEEGGGGGRDEEEEEEEEEEREEEFVPPHVIVARSHVMTFSMFEGVGRTLKGRDLRRVRNAVWRQTGFLD